MGKTYNLTTVMAAFTDHSDIVCAALSTSPHPCAMKLQPDQFNAPFINAYESDWISVNGDKYTGALMVSSEHGCSAWSATQFEDLQAENFQQLLENRPELVIFGSGARLRFPRPVWLKPLMEMGIGIETMDTPAACRTYNVLASEGRRVIAALLPPNAQ